MIFTVWLVTICPVLPTTATAQSRANDIRGLVERAQAALEAKQFDDALSAFSQAAKLAPQDASLALGAGYAAALLGRLDEARTWLERALKLNPRMTNASEILGAVLYRQGNVAEAVAVYETALKYAPNSTSLQANLERWREESQLHSRFYQAQGAHFSVLYEGPSDDAAARRAVEILEDAYWRIGQALTAYPTESVTVVLYTRQQFFDITRSPGWTGGLYDGRIKVPMAGALRQADELKRILEHEFVHALVASIGAAAAPVWLNEGLATVFEPGGLEAARATLGAETERLPFSRLEGSFRGLSDRQVSIAYAQSAVAVKALMDLRGASAFVPLLQLLRRGSSFASAFQQSMSMRYEDFAAMMERR